MALSPLSLSGQPIYKPFVKRVGGKRQLLTQFQSLYPPKFNNYFEPFVGGGAVFFDLKNNGKITQHATLSDVNDELINVYNTIKNNLEKLIDELKLYQSKHSKDFFMEIRAWDQRSDFKSMPDYKRAARFIYLNRTCFNGMYRVNGNGYFNVPFGKYSNPKICDEEGLIKTKEALEDTTILNQSFTEVVNLAKKGDFVYFDPPYDTLSTTANFTDYIQGGFGKDMQKELANTFKKLSEMGCFVMLSNHNTPFIQELYKDFRQEVVSAKRMINSDASKRGAIKEIVVLSY